MKVVFKSLVGIFVGFIVALVTIMVLSFFSIFIFSYLIVDKAPMDILMTSVEPLVYSLFTIFVGIVIGIYLSAQISGSPNIVNAILVAAMYGGFMYYIGQSPSNLDKEYPIWYEIASNIVLVPSFIAGYFLTLKAKSNTR
ncbi:hypothetical protein [Microbulbifer sp. JTAC008]|uniref:hypothetical protein n=1 Tax=unclassified Microbulbifer TaxID=2619833 RepID=UPI00403A5DE0